MTDLPLIFTIGHSNHPIETFIVRLQTHEIECLVDVRSVPYSRFSPHFRKQTFETHLQNVGIKYLYLGDKLGGWPGESEGNRQATAADYERMSEEPAYETGIQQLLAIAHENRTVIMCSEENPNQCHRNLLIADSLLRRSLATVKHIRGDGDLENASLKPKQPKLL